MGNTLITLGFILILAVIALNFLSSVVTEVPALQDFITPRINNLILICAGASLLLGFLMRLLKPVGKTIRYGRCQVCKKKIPKGEIYCPTHLRQTVYQARDQDDF